MASEEEPMLAKHPRYLDPGSVPGSGSGSGSGVEEDVVRPKRCGGITVEPILMLYLLGASSLRTTNEQYIYWRFLGYWADVLDPPSSSDNGTAVCGEEEVTALEAAAQASTASFVMAYELTLLLPGILMAFWIGSHSDRSGRKLPLFLPTLGVFLRAAASFLVAHFDLNVYYLFIGVALDAISGSQCVLIMTAYAYIADVSELNKRSIRVFIVQTVGCVGQSIAQLTVGYLIFYTSWPLPYFVIAALVSITFPVLWSLPESVKKKKTLQAGGCTSYAKHTLRVLANDGARAHVVTRLLLALVFLTTATKEGFVATLILYFLKSPICLNAIYVAYVGVSLWLGGSLLSFTALWILGKLGSQHLGNIMVGLIATALSKLYLFLPLTGLVVPFGYSAVASLGMIVSSESRAMLSTLVAVDEQGAMSALITIANLLGFTAGNILINTVYAATVALYAKTAFVMVLVFDVGSLVILGVSMSKWKTASRMELRYDL